MSQVDISLRNVIPEDLDINISVGRVTYRSLFSCESSENLIEEF